MTRGLDLMLEIAGIRGQIDALQRRVAVLEERNQNTVKVQVLTPEELVQRLKRNHRGNGDETRTPLPEFWNSDDAQVADLP